ncbi:MAG TPA: hypothetical protein ENN96_02355, partial [Candidatus Acetothermia bacterium]|nr:hypothetical protein [Candidatus Acetothermia bacterium]
LQRLARGTGPAGLKGMLPVRPPYVRPLIAVRRAQVHAYATAHALQWREDVTNRDLSLARNRLRLRVLPELAAINPRAVEAINRAADLTAELVQALADRLDGVIRPAASPQGTHPTAWSRAALRSLSSHLRPYVVRELLLRARGTADGITHKHIDQICALLESDQGHGEICLPGTRLIVDQDGVFLADALQAAEPLPETPVALGQTRLPGGASLTVLPRSRNDIDWPGLASDRWMEAVDPEQVRLPLLLRTRRPGDRFVPLGMHHAQKLKDFFIDRHVAHRLRDRIPLLCDSEGIVWVVGFRIAQRVRLTEDTQHVLLLKMEGMK